MIQQRIYEKEFNYSKKKYKKLIFLLTKLLNIDSMLSLQSLQN